MNQKMFEKLKTEKGQGGISLLVGFVISIFVAGMVILSITLVGSEMVDNVDDGQHNETVTAINNTYQGIAGLTDWFSTFNTMIAAVVIMGLLGLIVASVGGFGFGRGGA